MVFIKQTKNMKLFLFFIYFGIVFLFYFICLKFVRFDFCLILKVSKLFLFFQLRYIVLYLFEIEFILKCHHYTSTYTPYTTHLLT